VGPPGGRERSPAWGSGGPGAGLDGCYRARRRGTRDGEAEPALSAGRAAMWIIATGIAGALVIVLVVNGLSGIPFEWIGLAVGAALATTAFVLGLFE
jgi:hypothetical protein